MEIQTKEALSAEIEQFKEEALKMHIVQVLADTYTKTNLFDYNIIDSDGSVIWYKAQARQLWDFWQAAKTQTAEKIEALQNAVIFADECRKEWHESYMRLREDKAQAVLEWNSVDDKEPPLGTMVLICWSDAPDVEPEKDYMDHDVDHGVNYWANYNDGNEPSHWMLLPKPVAQEQSHEH